MVITRKELLSKQYEIIDIVLEFDTVNDGEANSFLMHVFEKTNKVYITHQFNLYNTFFYALGTIPIEEEEKVELIKEVAQFQDEWKSTLKGEGLPETELLAPDKVVEEWEDYNNLDDEIEQSIDREYYVAAACDIFEYDGDPEKFLEAVNKGIDKAIEAYTTDGKLVVEDWDMFDQDMRHYMESELEKI